MLRVLTPLVVVVCGAQAAPAQTAWRFRWQAGQVLTYRVEQQTRSLEVDAKGKVETKARVRLIKRWQVLAVDKDGIATLRHSLVSLRLENTAPSGEVIVFDSADPDKSDPQLREQMAPMIGVPLSTLRVDGLGRLVQVKESKFGPASRYEAELPFLIALPGTEARPGQSWQRAYQITVEPPQGTGEKYQATQTYSCQRVEGVGAYLRLKTELKTLPEALGDQIPLLRLQPEGEAIFDLRAGRLHAARLTVRKELKGHQGAGSSYLFESTYTEQYAGDK